MIDAFVHWSRLEQLGFEVAAARLFKMGPGQACVLRMLIERAGRPAADQVLCTQGGRDGLCCGMPMLRVTICRLKKALKRKSFGASIWRGPVGYQIDQQSARRIVDAVEASV